MQTSSNFFYLPLFSRLRSIKVYKTKITSFALYRLVERDLMEGLE